MLYAGEMTSSVGQLQKMRANTRTLQIPSIDDIINAQSCHYPYEKQISEAPNDPVVILHSSGSTGESSYPRELLHVSLSDKTQELLSQSK